MKNIIIQVTLPTTRQLGGPLPVDQILHSEIELSADAGASYSLVEKLPPNVLETPVNDLPVSDQYIARGRVQDTAGVDGNWIEVPFEIVDDSPPGDLVINIAIQ